MAKRSVVMDGELNYFEVGVPAIEALLAGGVVQHVRSHYVGDFEDANVYKPLARRSLMDVWNLVGAGAKTEIVQGSGGG